MTKTGGNGLIRPYSSELAIVTQCIDGIIIIAAVYCYALLYLGFWPKKYTLVVAIALIFFYFASRLIDLYRSVRILPFGKIINLVFTTWAWVTGGLLLIGYLFKVTGDYSRVVFGLWIVTTPIFLVGWRLGLRKILSFLRARGHNTRSVIIVGTSESARNLRETLLKMEWAGFSFLGYVTEADWDSGATGGCLESNILGGTDILLHMARENLVDVIFIALPLSQESVISDLMDQLSDTATSVFLAPNVGLAQLKQREWVIVGDQPVVSVMDTPLHGIGSWLKRVEDVVLSLLGIGLCAVPMIVIALLVKDTSPGPVIYRQVRYGLRGEELTIFKFRTMYHSKDTQYFRQAQKDDARVTPLGKILRSTSLDELPQLFNVLRGEMSVVGPRPHAIAHSEEFRGTIWGYMMRHIVKPGMTGWAQVHGWRGETDVHEKMEMRIKYDLEYINQWSVWLDIKILAMTPVAILTKRNAY